MMGAATPFSKLKRPDDSRPTGGFAQYSLQKMILIVYQEQEKVMLKILVEN